MTTGNDHADYWKSIGAEHQTDSAGVRFEAGRVRFVLTALHLQRRRQRLVDWQVNRAGDNHLVFAAFNACVTEFPFVLGTNILRRTPVIVNGKEHLTEDDYTVHRDPRSTEPARFKRFGQVPFVAAYQSFYDQVAGEAKANDRRVGLIFPRKGFRDGMIIHNDERETYWTSGLCWVYKIPNRPGRLYVQPLRSLIDEIYGDGHVWAEVSATSV